MASYIIYPFPRTIHYYNLGFHKIIFTRLVHNKKPEFVRENMSRSPIISELKNNPFPTYLVMITPPINSATPVISSIARSLLTIVL